MKEYGTNVEFLMSAITSFVPVFLFTNENRAGVERDLPEEILRDGSPVFIKEKSSLLVDGRLDFGAIEDWIGRSAAVYALKVWERTLLCG